MKSSPIRSAPCERFGMWLALFAVLTVVPACATGHAVRGTVIAVAPTHIEVRHKSGQRVSVELDPQTSFRRGDHAATVNDVRVGGRVTVVLDEGERPFRASEVRIFSRSRASSNDPVGRQLPLAGEPAARNDLEQ